MYDVEISTAYGILKSRFRPSRRSDGLVVMFLGGLLSDQLATQDSRTQVLDAVCFKCGVGSIRFNYTAHGWHPTTRSSGEFRDVSVTRMVEDADHVIRHFAPHKVAFAASSIGAGLLPFLLERLEGKHVLGGCFTVSAVSPEFLKVIVDSALLPAEKVRFANGEDVDLRSPTLPVTIQVNRFQMNDLDAYRELPVLCHWATSRPPRLLRGTQDGLSTLQYNDALARALGGSEDDIVLIESGHEIPFGPMLGAFESWLIGFDLAEIIAI